MAMIEVEHLQKNFVKTVKEPGIKERKAPFNPGSLTVFTKFF